MVAAEGLVCGSSTAMHPLGEPIAGGPGFPPAWSTKSMPPMRRSWSTSTPTRNASWPCCSPLVSTTTKPDVPSPASCLTIAEEGEENVRLRGVGVDPGETSTTQIPDTTTTGPNGTTNTTVPSRTSLPWRAMTAPTSPKLAPSTSSPFSTTATLNLPSSPSKWWIRLNTGRWRGPRWCCRLCPRRFRDRTGQLHLPRASDRELFSETATVTVTVAASQRPASSRRPPGHGR